MEKVRRAVSSVGDFLCRCLKILHPFLLTFCLFSLMPPARVYLSAFYMHYGKYLKFGIAAVFYAVLFIDTLRRKKLDIFVAAYCIYGCSIVVSSLYNGTAYGAALWTYFLAPGAMLLLIKYSLQVDERKTLVSLICTSLGYGFLYLAADYLQIGYADQDVEIWLHARSCYLYYALVGTLAFFCFTAKNCLKKNGSFYKIKERNRLFFCFIFLLFALELAGAYRAGKSLTTLITLLLFVLYLPFCLIDKGKIRFPVWLFPFIYAVCLPVILFPQTIIEHSFLGSILSGMGKSLTFSGRTPIWEKAMKLIADRPLLGLGAQSLYNFIGYENPHNEMLYVLLHRGLLGLILLIVFLAVLLKKVDSCRNRILRNGLLWFLFCLSIGTMFEVPTMMPMVACLSLSYYVSENTGGVYE